MPNSGNDDLDQPTCPLPPGEPPPSSPPDARKDSSLPNAFGRYRVLSHLGKGGFGNVYRAFDDQLERNVAIKVTLGSLLAPSMRQSFLTEATPDDTELRLLRAVRKAIPDAEGGSLRDVLSNIRRHRLVPDRGKLLLILDQFEQWLFGQSDYAKASLTDALASTERGRLV